MLRYLQFAACILFFAALAFVCYRRPIPDDFDRYIYEAIVLGKSQPIDAVYETVKHENPRAEASSVLDSPQHLKELEPLYAIRPFYLVLISWLSPFLPIQHAINLISAISLLGIGVVVLLWTKRPIESALLIAAYPIMNLGRMGSPDALAALFTLSALYLLAIHGQRIAGLALLFLSLTVRTDNLLVLLAVLVWIVWDGELVPSIGGLLALVGVGIVLAINHAVGNYGWIVLFRYSFLSGKYPALMPHTLSLREYVIGFSAGFPTALTQMAIWLLIGIWAALRRPHALLWVAAASIFTHFLLFPSAEIRYLLWAGILASTLLIRSFADEPSPPRPAP